MCSPRPSLTALLLIAGACHIHNLAVRAVAEPTKSGGQAAISGTIVNASAAPIAGARVTLYRLESPNGRWGRFKIAHERSTTDEAGTYRFPGLGDGYFMVSVEGARFARTLRAATIQDHASQQVDIVLKPPVSLVIRVEDQDGKPVCRSTSPRDHPARCERRVPTPATLDALDSAFRSHPATRRDT